MASAKIRVLLAHDASAMADSATAALAPALRGAEVLRATSVEEIARLGHTVDLAVAIHDPEGWSPVEALQPYLDRVKVVVLARRPNIDEAVRLLKAGFVHYADVLGSDELLAKFLRLQLDDARTRADDVSPAVVAPTIVGDSSALREVRQLLERVAKSPASTVLITGESGTGKDVSARTIHALSDRRHGPFLNITCSAIPETLLESELFGHERGAFTDAHGRKIGLVEQAHGGTLFLDEIGEMSPGLQAKLLRLLEEKSFRRVGGSTDLHPDIRIVAATNRDLQGLVREGRFRADLFYRLAVLQIHVPALRERPDDIAPLAAHFAAQFGARFGRTVQRLTPAALDLLRAHPWAGNVRELRNTLERAVLLCEQDTIDVDHIALAPAPKATAAPSSFRLPSEGLVLSELENDLVTQALQAADGNVSHAAKLLGMSRDQLRYRVKNASGAPNRAQAS